MWTTRYLERYGILAHRAGQPTPGYLIEAETLEELAAKINVPAENLAATVARFNEYAVKGEDPDFGRGESAYDKYWGDDDNPWPNPSLGPLQTGPFYALEVVNGAFGTNGGVATDGLARVLDVDNRAHPRPVRRRKHHRKRLRRRLPRRRRHPWTDHDHGLPRRTHPRRPVTGVPLDWRGCRAGWANRGTGGCLR